MTGSDRNRRPNLFGFATSELSQDAFFAWLAQWADPSHAENDRALHDLGTAFLMQLFGGCLERCPPVVQTVVVRRQHMLIDVLIEVNNTIAICLEDKRGTREHSGQLQRYLTEVQRGGFQNPVGVYVQTHEQSNLEGVAAAGYHVVRRSDLLSLLRAYTDAGGTDSIVQDYYAHLSELDSAVRGFRTRELPQWGWYEWQGFFGELKKELRDGDWDYVSNARGGFQAFWWGGVQDGDAYLYPQLENASLAFKLGVEDTARRHAVRSAWRPRIEAAAAALGFTLKQVRARTGRSMTLALVEDYRVADATGCLDFAATMAVLRNAEQVIGKARSSAMMT